MKVENPYTHFKQVMIEKSSRTKLPEKETAQVLSICEEASTSLYQRLIEAAHENPDLFYDRVTLLGTRNMVQEITIAHLVAVIERTDPSIQRYFDPRVALGMTNDFLRAMSYLTLNSSSVDIPGVPAVQKAIVADMVDLVIKHAPLPVGATVVKVDYIGESNQNDAVLLDPLFCCQDYRLVTQQYILDGLKVHIPRYTESYSKGGFDPMIEYQHQQFLIQLNQFQAFIDALTPEEYQFVASRGKFKIRYDDHLFFLLSNA